jgi:signal transduction histidine kinase
MVDDNPADVRLVREALRGRSEQEDVPETPSLHVIDESSLSRGLQRLRQGGVDAVLLDLMLPDGAGLETFQELNRQFPDVPVVILSGTLDTHLAAHAVRMGAQDYIRKDETTGPLLRRSLLYAVARAGAGRERALLAQERAARQATEISVARISRLQALTAALSEAVTFAQAAEVVTTHGVAAFGASAGAIALLTEDRSKVELVHSVGYSDAVKDAWRTMDVHRPLPLTDAVRTGEPLFIESLAQRAQRYPDIPLLPQGQQGGAWVAIPITAEGSTVGGLALSFPAERTFTEADRTFMLTLARQCSQALERARLYDDAQRALRARDEFLSAVAHDLRTPLSTIKSGTQLLRRRISRVMASGEQNVEVLTAQLGEYVESLGRVDEASSRMASALDQLFDVARSFEGRGPVLARERTDLVALVRRTVTDHIPLAPQHELRLDVADAGGDGALWGTWDGPRLRRVVENLLSNAVKYSPAGGTIRVAVERRDGHAVLTVRDDGIGIPAPDLPHVFERYRRGGNVTGRIAGSGIGLASVRQTVEQHGGTITVDSAEGTGSTFTVTLPLGGHE